MGKKEKGKIIFLLTESDNDWGRLEDHIRPDEEPLIIDPMTGRVLKVENVARVNASLIIFRLRDKQSNTDSLRQIVDPLLDGCQIVIGIHSPVERREYAENYWLEEGMLFLRSEKVLKYSTNEYAFLATIPEIISCINANQAFSYLFEKLWKVFIGEDVIPWRYEYFLEIGQRLLMLDSQENIAVLNKIFFDISPAEAQYQAICEHFQPYKQVCGGFNAAEQQQFTRLQQKAAEFLKPPYPGQHFGENDPQYQEKYREIYDLLWGLAEKEALAYD